MKKIPFSLHKKRASSTSKRAWFKKRIFKSQSGNVAVPMIFVMFLVFTFFVLMPVMLTYARVMTHQHEIDDDLADSTLACMIVNVQQYNEDRTLHSGKVPIYYASTDNSYQIYKKTFDMARKNGDPSFYQNFTYDTLILYEVDPIAHTTTVTTFDEHGNKNVETHPSDQVATPDGKTVTETSAYAHVSFDILTYFANFPAEHKARKIYCTIDQVLYNQL
jgi:Flp pilus assembly protein TadG